MKPKHISAGTGPVFGSNRTVQSNRKFEDHYFTRDSKKKNKPDDREEVNETNQDFGNCNICGKMTDKCCSLCLKVFYCSNEHQ